MSITPQPTPLQADLSKNETIALLLATMEPATSHGESEPVPRFGRYQVQLTETASGSPFSAPLSLRSPHRVTGSGAFSRGYRGLNFWFDMARTNS
jgi:hypothetical protein